MTEENRRPTQSERVLRYMRSRGSITHLESMNTIGVMRLASRIAELKKDGYPIGSRMDKVKNRWGETCRVKRYYLEEGKEGEPS